MLAVLQTDTELLKQFELGDELAFEKLYRRHKRRLWGMARKMGYDIQQAEDILVEAMSAVALQARKGRIHGSFIGYALTAIHHRGLHVQDTCSAGSTRIGGSSSGAQAAAVAAASSAPGAASRPVSRWWADHKVRL